MKQIAKTILKLLISIHNRERLLNLFVQEETYLIYCLFNFFPEKNRLMMDVGAGYGSTFEIFAKNDWNVYAFEPDSKNREKSTELASRYNLDKIVIDPRAVSDKVVENVPFFRSDVSAGISGLSSFDQSHYSAEVVNTVTLQKFCEEQNIDKIDYLKVDAEGFDFHALRGIDWTKVCPQVIMCEFEDDKTIPLGYTLNDMCNYLNEKGYQVLVSEWYPVVKRGGPHKWKKFAKFDGQILGEKSWGNIIAVHDDKMYQKFEKIACSKSMKLRWTLGYYFSITLDWVVS